MKRYVAKIIPPKFFCYPSHPTQSHKRFKFIVQLSRVFNYKYQQTHIYILSLSIASQKGHTTHSGFSPFSFTNYIIWRFFRIMMQKASSFFQTTACSIFYLNSPISKRKFGVFPIFCYYKQYCNGKPCKNVISHMCKYICRIKLEEINGLKSNMHL